MTSKKYIFRAASTPSHHELHCLWATLTDKAHENQPDLQFKVVSNGRLVQVVAAVPLQVRDVTLVTNAFAFLRTESVEPTAYGQGQMVNLQGQLAYSVHSISTRRHECPVDSFGRVKPHLRETFLAYLTAQTGVDFEQAYQLDSLEFDLENRSVPEMKVRLDNVITFNVTARIADAAVLNSLPLRAIGRRRSYGLGSTQVARVADTESGALSGEPAEAS